MVKVCSRVYVSSGEAVKEAARLSKRDGGYVYVVQVSLDGFVVVKWAKRVK